MAEEDSASQSKSWFPAIPLPIKRVFDQFPLVTYPPNTAPASSSISNKLPDEHRLYVFTSPQAARKGRPSMNPQCLKWQAYLKFCGIQFRTIPSNNHASPNGALPFLLPAPGGIPGPDCVLPVPSNKLQQWADEHTDVDQDKDADSSNFESIAGKAYVNPSTTNPAVRMALAYQLREAARSQLQRASPYIDADDLLAEAKSAFCALSVVLGSDDFFFGRAKPGLFDASVFAYTHLILDQTLGWQRNPLATYLSRHENLVQHRQRLLDTYF
ncbi:hypothetical protein MferCBS49748_003505 [Microsporum ferrugineum]